MQITRRKFHEAAGIGMLAENSSMLKILKHLGAQIRREDGPIQRVDLILSS